MVSKEKLYIIFNIFFIPIIKILNTFTLNILLSLFEVSLNMILSFYVSLVFLYVQSSSLISALQILKSKKYFTAYSNPKRVTEF